MKKLIPMLLVATILSGCTSWQKPVIDADVPPVDLYVQLPIYEYSTDTTKIEYKIVNNTGEYANIVLIPKLERNLGLQFEEKYEQVEYSDSVGFCGTPDRIEKEYIGEIELSCFKDVSVGKYKLYFETADGKRIGDAEFVINHSS